MTDERIRKKIEQTNDLLGLCTLDDFYDDEEIENLARLPIELCLPLMTQLIACAQSTSREFREQNKEEREDKQRFKEENV